jgi:hypothetical protein
MSYYDHYRSKSPTIITLSGDQKVRSFQEDRVKPVKTKADAATYRGRRAVRIVNDDDLTATGTPATFCLLLDIFSPGERFRYYFGPGAELGKTPGRKSSHLQRAVDSQRAQVGSRGFSMRSTGQAEMLRSREMRRNIASLSQPGRRATVGGTVMRGCGSEGCPAPDIFVREWTLWACRGTLTRGYPAVFPPIWPS